MRRNLWKYRRPLGENICYSVLHGVGNTYEEEILSKGDKLAKCWVEVSVWITSGWKYYGLQETCRDLAWFILCWTNGVLSNRMAKYLCKFGATPEKMTRIWRGLLTRKELKNPEYVKFGQKGLLSIWSFKLRVYDSLLWINSQELAEKAGTKIYVTKSFIHRCTQKLLSKMRSQVHLI